MKCVLACAVSFALMLSLFCGMAWLCGFTPAGVLYGHWPENDDHPTNYYARCSHDGPTLWTCFALLRFCS